MSCELNFNSLQGQELCWGKEKKKILGQGGLGRILPGQTLEFYTFIYAI